MESKAKSHLMIFRFFPSRANEKERKGKKNYLLLPGKCSCFCEKVEKQCDDLLGKREDDMIGL